MLILKLENIKQIYKSTDNENRGYFIEFIDEKKIYLTKRRTIIALLVLIKNGTGSEVDLANGNKTIGEIKQILKDKISGDFIQNSYGDANKPFSELWNEEGFTWINNLSMSKVGKSQVYELKQEDHYKLLDGIRKIKKANRKAPSYSDQLKLKTIQENRCNLCGALLLSKKDIQNHTYQKDRKREVCDHRIPVEKGGNSLTLDNYQMLCFYCNKSKWQICNICVNGKCLECALAYPENTKIISPTKEDIEDRMAK